MLLWLHVRPCTERARRLFLCGLTGMLHRSQDRIRATSESPDLIRSIQKDTLERGQPPPSSSFQIEGSTLTLEPIGADFDEELEL